MQATFPLSQKLVAHGELERTDAANLETVCGNARALPPKRLLSRHGGDASVFPVLLEGWAARQRILRSGARQITRVMLAGDVGYHDGPVHNDSDEEIMTLCPSKVAFVPFSRFEEFMSHSPGLSRAMSELACEETTLQKNALVRLGRLTALERMADFICETCDRLRSANLITDTSFYFPLTQEDLADILGLTPVHVNRKLQELRQEGLITLKSRRLTIRDLHSLQAIAGYDAHEENLELGSHLPKPAFA